MSYLFLAHLLNGLLMIAMPIGLALFLSVRWKLGARLWLIGAATFILSQIGHIPFNSLFTLVVNRTPLTEMSERSALLFNAVYVGLSAGLFEELFRYGMFRWWAKDARSWRKGVLTGAGHGGAEAIIFGAIALYNFVQFAYLRNADLSKLVPTGQLAQTQLQISGYWSMTWFEVPAGCPATAFLHPDPYRHGRARPANLHAQAMVLGLAGGSLPCCDGYRCDPALWSRRRSPGLCLHVRIRDRQPVPGLPFAPARTWAGKSSARPWSLEQEIS